MPSISSIILEEKHWLGSMPNTYYSSAGGHPDQNQLMTGRAVFTPSYAFLPKGCLRDIVTSKLPFWEKTRLWVLSRPMSGFSETFSQYLMEVAGGGGSSKPETQENVESVLFILSGQMVLNVDGKSNTLTSGGFAYVPPDVAWTLKNISDEPLTFHWIRKEYIAVSGLEAPDIIIANEQNIEPVSMPETNGKWATTRFVDPDDMRHDMHVNIVTLEPGARIPFEETHVMEHGLFVLQGTGVYKLNQDWIEVEAGDFMWLRAFCPQACYAGGTERFRYLLYKDVNRHMPLQLG